MAGKIISTDLTHNVTLGAGVYLSPLTITTTGGITPPAPTSIALYVETQAALATLVNHGSVLGSNGVFGYNYGTGGGIAIEVASGTTINNTGLISGGYGGASEGPAAAGGLGIDIKATAIVTNSGTISGGSGGYEDGNFGGTPGTGGTGLLLETHATLINSGLVAGGAGGGAYTTGSYGEGAGGIAIAATSEGVIKNTGIIIGGAAQAGNSHYSAYGDKGGVGISLGIGGILTNGGTVIGGSGGGSSQITDGGYGADGVYIGEASGSNTGLIEGGSGGNAGFYAGHGGDGIEVASYASFANAGHLMGGTGGVGGVDDSGSGGAGLVTEAYGTATNTGTITGGVGGAAQAGVFAGAGGSGAFVSSGRFVNRGAVHGGLGGTGGGDSGQQSFASEVFSGAGGTGISIGNFYGAPNFVVNYSVVTGGAGGYMSGLGGTAGGGGAGVGIFQGTFVNHGTVLGGVGGDTGQSAFNYGYGGAGGAGVSLFGGATVTNAGTIIGGTGGSNIYVGATGGAGVLMTNGGILIDSGVIRGGTGGFSQGPGAQGDAVLLTGSIGGTLVLDPGASFTGLVVADTTADNVLEVAGSSTSVLTGIGTEFTGFETVRFATGAIRTIEGSAASLGDISGIAPKDIVVIDGYTATLANTEVYSSEINLYSGTTNLVAIATPNSTAKDYIFSVGGGKTTIAAVLGTFQHVVGANMQQQVLFGGTSTATTLTAGGSEIVQYGGTASATKISGGKLELEIGAKITDQIAFTTVKGGELVIDSAIMPAATISGFIAGDSIALSGIVYNKADTVSVKTAGIVTITTPGATYSLHIAGAKVGETDFKFGAGSVLTRTAAPAVAMNFLSPDTATMAAVPSTPAAAPAGTDTSYSVPPIGQLVFTHHQNSFEATIQNTLSGSGFDTMMPGGGGMNLFIPPAHHIIPVTDKPL